MNNVDQGLTLLIAVVLALIALAGVVMLRPLILKLLAMALGIVAVLYVLGYLPTILPT
jgi:hypothetical protein